MPIKINSTEFYLLKNSDIGERIKFLRKKLMDEIDSSYYTTGAIAKRTGIAPQTITSIERGESKKPSFSVIQEIAKEFNVSVVIFTDEYYEGPEKLFSIGKDNESVEVDLDDFDSLIIDNKEYFTSDIYGSSETWEHRRKISFIVHEELSDGREKQLYFSTKHLKEISLIDILSKIIQTVELTPYDLSSTEWSKALERSPLKEASEIVSKDYNELPDLQILKGGKI